MALFSRRQERDTTEATTDESRGVPSGQTGPVSRPVASVTGPTTIVELHDTLLHTATPRYIAALGLAATLVTGVLATIPSFTEDGLLNMRPQIDEALVLSVAVMAFGCLWWSTFATMNGRRVTRDRTLGPVLPMAVSVGIAVSYLAINATVHGEARVWAWAAWVLVVLTVHSFVMVAFKSSAQAIGNPTTHFIQMAIIPATIAGTVAVGLAVGAVEGIPFLAVPLLMAWMVLVLFRAMRGWDRACRQRMRVMLRDFTYDTPSGSTPVTTNPPATGRTTAVAPMTTAAMPVANPDAPARVPGTHHPVRPTWNPVEEARRKAELQAAGAMSGVLAGAGGPSALDTYLEGTAPRRVQAARRRHRTLIPKLMVTFGPFAWLLGIPVGFLLRSSGHMEFDVRQREYVYDDAGRTVEVVLLAVCQSCTFIGWLWWSTASLANVRQRSLNSPWPGIVAASYWAMLGGVALMLIAAETDLVVLLVAGIVVAIVAALYSYFGVFSSLRQAAGMIGAPKESWTTQIRMPFIICGTVVTGLLIALWTQSGYQVGVILFFVVLGLYTWQAVAFVRAVWSFDRVCKAPPPPKVEEAQVPLFLRHAIGAR